MVSLAAKVKLRTTCTAEDTGRHARTLPRPVLLGLRVSSRCSVDCGLTPDIYQVALGATSIWILVALFDLTCCRGFHDRASALFTRGLRGA
eukprot:scaffold318_cov396-Prasinococcus_capsulatus_cf.AAC.20